MSRSAEKIFIKFKKGDVGALPDLLEKEKESLFDYLVRMTGSVGLATDTIDDVFLGLTDEHQYDMQSYGAFRRSLFVTARRFTADNWNAKTPNLENPIFNQPGSFYDLPQALQDEYRALDRSLQNLEGPLREAVVLKERCEFSDEDLALIMDRTTGDAVDLYLKGMQKIDAECAVENPEKKVRQMPGHPAPEKTNAMTMDLSMVMQGIQQKPAGLRSPGRIAFLIILIGLVLAGYFHQELLAFLGMEDLVSDFSTQGGQ